MAQTTFFNATGLDEMANGSTVNKISLHSGAPGVAGDENVVSAAVAATFSAAEADGDNRKRVLASQVDFTGLTPLASVVNIGLWHNTTYLGYCVRTSGDAAVNAAGNYSVTTGSKIVVGNSTT